MDVALITDLALEQPCISFYDITNGVLLKNIKNSMCCPNGYGFVQGELIFAAQNNKQLIHVYDTNKEQCIKKIVCPGKITCLTVSPDGNYCIVALVDKIYIWQIATGNLINILCKHYQTINCIKFTTNGTYFVSCGDDNLVLIWNFASALQPLDSLNPENTNDKPVHTLSHHSLPVKDVYIGITNTRCHMVTVSLDQTCNIIDLCSGQLLSSIVLDNGCSSVAMDALEQQIFVGTVNGKIYFINCFEKTKSNTINIEPDSRNFTQAHSKEIKSLSVSMDATILLSGSLDSSVKLWHISSRQCLRTFSFKGGVTNAAFLHAPSFLQNSYKPPKVQHIVGNFKRSIYKPNIQDMDFDTMKCDENSLVPIVLKNIHESCSYIWNNDNTEETTAYDQLKLEYLKSQLPSTNVDSIKNATRSELIQKVNELQTMANEFYGLAKDKLLIDVNGIKEINGT